MIMKNILLLVLLAAPFLGCPGSDEYCLYCEQDTCKSCAMTYLNEKVCTLPTATIDKCVEYVNATLCSDCDIGYKLASDKKSCVSIGIDNCAAVDEKNSNDKCMECMNAKKNDPATGKCTDEDCKVDNCKMCHVASEGTVNIEVCRWCNDGYSVQDGTCIADPITNCQAALGGKCVSCYPGYYWKDGTCAESTKYSW